MTDITSHTRGEMFAEESADGLLALLTISHADLTTDIRVVNNHENITSRGNEFIAFPFDLVLPTSDAETPPRARLTIDNVSREIGSAVRSISSPATVLVEVVQMNSPDNLEFSHPELVLKNVRMDASRVTGDLLSEDLQIEPYPFVTFNPADFPGLF